MEAFQRFRFALQERRSSGNFLGDLRILFGRFQQPFKAELYVRRRQRAAVGKHDAFLQRKTVGQSVPADGVIRHKALHNFRSAALPRPCLKQPVEHVHRNQVIVRRQRHVHSGNIVGNRGPQQAGFRGVRQRRTPKQHGSQYHQENSFHASVLPFRSPALSAGQ